MSFPLAPAVAASTLVPPLLMGLFGSAHCATMCGGIAGSLCAALPPGARSRVGQGALYGAAYNGGRIASYAGAGFVAGSMGTMARAVFPTDGWAWALRLAAGLLLVGVGLFIAGVWARFSRVEALGGPLWAILRPVVARLLPVRSTAQAALLGLLWGWLPCGLVYVALSLAVGAGSGAAGALTMVAFGLGTTPALLVVGALSGVVARVARWGAVRRAAGVALVAFGLLNVTTSMAHAGWIHPGGERAHACGSPP